MMRSLKWKLTINSILMCSLLSGVLVNFTYADKTGSSSLSVITTTQAYINHQTIVQQPEQNIVYHPTLGYMDYQQIWCNDDHQSAMKHYQHFITQVCLERGGSLTKNWCTLSGSQQPLFYTFIAAYDLSCHSDEATIVHIIEVMPNIKNNTVVAKAWIKTAKSLGF